MSQSKSRKAHIGSLYEHTGWGPYLAAEWPDFTDDLSRAARGEPEQVSETFEQQQERVAWMMLALGDLRPE